MPERRLTTEEAIAYALDPRNDDGTPEAIHVMAQNYDQDCPNVDDHEFVNVHNEQDASKCYVDEVCKCWDGITRDDVDTWTDMDGGNLPVIDSAGFALWGPFELWFDIEPGAPR